MAEKYIHCCVKSILEQTYKNLEIFLVDDGSKDKCGEICDEYQKLDSRVKVIHQENAGVAAARNTALKHCKGKFVTFVDSDDYIADDLIEVLYSQIGDADYVSGGFSRCDDEKNVKYIVSPTEEIVLSGKDTINRHYTGENSQAKICCFYVCGTLYKNELWKGLEFPEGLLFEDMYLMPYLHLRCKKVKYIPYVGYYYRDNPNSITNAVNLAHRKKAFKDSFTIWDDHSKLYEERLMEDLVVAVECLKIDKIISHSTADTIPEGMDKLSKRILKKSIGKVLRKEIPFRQKMRYILFLLLGKNMYKSLRKIIKR